MGISGDCIKCEFNPRDWGEMRVEVLNLAGAVGRHAIVLETLAEVPEAMRGLKDSIVRISDVIMDVSSKVDDLNAWRSDDKTLRIKNLEGELAHIREETERDRLDFRRSVRAALLSALCTLLFVALPAAYVSHKLYSPQQVVRVP